MKFKIYDFENKAAEVDVDKKIVDHITVIVLSGDEVVNVFYKDGTHEEFDSSNVRGTDYYDGMYEVCGTELFKWLIWLPEDENGVFSYQRLRRFGYEKIF